MMKYDSKGAPLMQESHFDGIRPFLTGKTLDTNFSFPISHVDVKTPTDRVTFLGSLLENKTVLHIGCADHLNVIDAKITTGKHLHSALIKRSKNVTGIDLNVEAIEHLQEKCITSPISISVIFSKSTRKVRTSQKVATTISLF